MKKANAIRSEFIQFFVDRGHTFVRSSSLLPIGDPTLLFTNAGMNQFKDVFLGTGTRPYKRATNSQKVLRVSGKHNDLDEVGRDTYHHTFFEMLGNWSFGDYYKREAIQWAWELLTEVWGLPIDRLYATVHHTDDEAAALWRELTPLPAERIMRFGDKENFWEMGETGPCGPCSEIHYDLGPEACDKGHVPGHRCGVNGGCGRYVELWNLVFIQYNRKADGTLEELPAKHVDTGMGFERIVAILQGKKSNYDTDLFTPIIEEILTLTGAGLEREEERVAVRVVADHIRALTFAIADGVLPANEGRGYVLRRILRRAARFARNLGAKEPLLHRLVPVVVREMGEAYPEIKEQAEHCSRVILAEEEAFGRTLDKGLALFADLSRNLRAEGKKIIPGAEAFKLYDTYGFPLDLTELMAAEEGLVVERDEFNRLMEAQRARARAGSQFGGDETNVHWEIVSSGTHSQFVGYEQLQTTTELRMIGTDDEYFRLVFAVTPFYAAGGGQVGDTGLIRVEVTPGSFVEFPVVDTQREQDKIVHLVAKRADFPRRAVSYTLLVDEARRKMTAANHTATHLLQAALRRLLGAHVQQAGSLVAPDRLRFDFNHYQRVDEDQLRQVEREVNQQIFAALPVRAEETDYQTALNRGALAFFGEKYGDRVRTLAVGDYSFELCGGTHVRNTAEIMAFRIITEGSVATGVRRIEAVTGWGALQMAAEERELLKELSALLQTEPAQLTEKVRALLATEAKLKKDLDAIARKAALAEGEELFAAVQEIGGHYYLVAKMTTASMDLMRETVDRFKDKYRSGVILLGAAQDDKVNFVAGVTKDLTAKLQAGNLVKQVAAITGGGGGGRPELAQAGGKNVDKLDEALREGERLIRTGLEG
ncbi:MAG TPA: alanine--tRNA ligase [Firmicutes bacterium]|nr:alanine--tRNA ligase [Bacillota bacterium]